MGYDAAQGNTQTVNLDQLCEDALTRMQQNADKRFAEFERRSREHYHFVRRSIAQKFRRLREELQRG